MGHVAVPNEEICKYSLHLPCAHRNRISKLPYTIELKRQVHLKDNLLSIEGDTLEKPIKKILSKIG